MFSREMVKGHVCQKVIAEVHTRIGHFTGDFTERQDILGEISVVEIE